MNPPAKQIQLKNIHLLQLIGEENAMESIMAMMMMKLQKKYQMNGFLVANVSQNVNLVELNDVSQKKDLEKVIFHGMMDLVFSDN